MLYIVWAASIAVAGTQQVQPLQNACRKKKERRRKVDTRPATLYKNRAAVTSLNHKKPLHRNKVQASFYAKILMKSTKDVTAYNFKVGY